MNTKNKKISTLSDKANVDIARKKSEQAMREAHIVSRLMQDRKKQNVYIR